MYAEWLNGTPSTEAGEITRTDHKTTEEKKKTNKWKTEIKKKYKYNKQKKKFRLPSLSRPFVLNQIEGNLNLYSAYHWHRRRSDGAQTRAKSTEFKLERFFSIFLARRRFGVTAASAAAPVFVCIESHLW